MQTHRIVILSALTLAAGVAYVRAGQVQIQQQMEVISGEPLQIGPQGRPARTGTGRIRGRVLSAESGTPVKRAQVRILGPDVPPRLALTDADGRYEFADLPDGRFTLTSSKAGYVNVQYGQTRPNESGKPIELADKQFVDRADITMPRGSVIVGRIVDELGEPVAEAMVSVMRQQWAGGRRRLLNAGRTAQTNDLGQFRLYGLPPGDYFVNATLRNTEGMMLDMMPMAAGPAPRSSSPGSGYAPTYYPGTASAADAQKITLAAGQETQGIDFPLAPVRLARITGIVLNSEGRPADGTMVSAVPSRGAEGAMMMMGGGARTSRDGAFTLSNVAPGDYMLQVRGMTITTSSVGDSMAFTTRIGGPGGDAEFAVQPITVSGEDLANVVITTTKGATATGKVIFEGERPASAGNVRVTSSSVDFDGPMMAMGGGGPGATVKADGTFELKGLAGSPRLFRVNGMPNGWTLKAVEANGIDVTDTGVEFKGSESVGGIDIILSPKSTAITGGVSAADGSPVRDYTLVIFSEDAQKWAVPSSRWISGTRPDQDGRFRVRNLPPGAYHAVAVDYIPQGEWNDPEVLERLRAKAQRLALGEGETKTLDLKIAGGA